ncbi:MAG: hypothetical protein MZW92_58705 [Comamonadaceae bacterium]|nr:hypothetical protein [Comamonadaceae bacterium]
MLYEHARARITGSGGEIRRAHRDGRRRGGAAAAGRHPPAGLDRCWACSTTTRPSRARASPACRCSGRWRRCATRPCAAPPRTSSWPCPSATPRAAPARAGAGRRAPACRC